MMEHVLKLTDVAITGRIDDRAVSLPEMHRRLNLVVIESQDSRRRIRRFLSSALGPAGSTCFTGTIEADQGYLQFFKGQRYARLGIGTEKYWSVEGLSSYTSGAVDQDLTMWLNAGQRDSFANMLDVDCDSENISNSPDPLNNALQSFVRRFASETAGGWRSESEYRNWLDESRQRRSRLDTIQSEIHRLEELRDRLDREIVVLDAALQSERARTVVAPVVDQSRPLRLVELFARIDEIDLQLASWQHVQGSIQEERLRLRNNAAKSTESGLTDDDHPYHKVWGIIGHVDAIVTQIARENATHCERIGAGLRSLCAELESQSRHVGHRATVAEMRQLRRCFDEVVAHMAKLSDRRKRWADEAAQLDPQLDGVFQKRGREFLQLLRAEGFQAARAHCLGEGWPHVPDVLTASIRGSDSTSQTALRNRLGELNRQRQVVDQELRQIDDDSRRSAFYLAPAMQMAGEILQQISNGNLIRFEVAGPVENVTRVTDPYRLSGTGVIDATGRHIAMETLSAESRRNCRISLAFAAQRQMRLRGEEIPMLVELSGPNLAEEWMILFTKLLEQQGLADHQVVLLSDRRPVLSSDSGIGRNDLFRIYDLNRIPVSESNARIVNWQKPDPLVHRFDPGVVHTGTNEQRNIHQPTHRFSSSLSEMRAAAANASDLPVVETAIAEETLLRNLGLCSKAVCESLESARIFTVADLMELDPFEMPDSIDERVVSPGELDRIQAASWLMICVPCLGTSDAQLLVNCGIVEPEQLDSTSSDQLQTRIARYLSTVNGVPLRDSAQRYTTDRLDRWFDRLRSTRDSWRKPSGYSRVLRRRSDDSQSSRIRDTDNQTGYFTREKNRDYRPGDRYFDDQGRSRPSLWRSPDNNDDPGRNGPAGELRGESGRKGSRNDTAAQLPAGMTFHLNLDDSVETAPSIGPKTAQRFGKIGVNSIREFLRTTSDAMAERLNYKRITSEVIRQWQDQSRLVCRVPNLRAHDAQLLVACGVTEPEKLESMSPNQLLSLVGPYSDTREGMKIVRSGKKPDLAEVTEWIQWARHTRSLTAA